MSLGRAHKGVSWKTLALVGALFALSLGALVFTSREAQAQQQYTVVTGGGPTVAINGDTAGLVAAMTPAESSPAEQPLEGLPPADLIPPEKPPPKVLSPPIDQHKPRPFHQYDPQPAPVTALPRSADPKPGPKLTSGTAAARPNSLPVSTAPKSIALAKNRPLSSHTEEKPSGRSSMNVPLAPLPENRPTKAVPTEPSFSVIYRKELAVANLEKQGPLPLPSLVIRASATVDTLRSAAESAVYATEAFMGGSLESARSPVAGSSEAAPLSPLTPPVGSSFFSLSGGVLVPVGGAAPLLLLCALVSGLLLLRPDGKLWWIFCQLPKPSSALLLPLERPG